MSKKINKTAKNQDESLDQTQLLLSKIEKLESENERVKKDLEFFLYNVGHDLKGPLTHIIGFQELFEETLDVTLNEKSKKFLSITKTAAKKLNLMIDAILKISRINNATVNFQEISVLTLIQEAITLITKEVASSCQVSNQKPPTLQWKFLDITDQTKITGDPILLKQVFLELIRNAVHFSLTTESPTIEIGMLKDKNLTFYVKDNGLGFSEKDRNKLFNLFQSLHSSEESSGVGGGLAIVKAIITKLGGEVWATGKEGAGSTFFFTVA